MQDLEKLSCEVETYSSLSNKSSHTYIQRDDSKKKKMLGHELMIEQALIRPISKIVFISF